MQSTEAYLKHLRILQGNAMAFLEVNAITIATHQGRLAEVPPDGDGFRKVAVQIGAPRVE